MDFLYQTNLFFYIVMVLLSVALMVLNFRHYFTYTYHLVAVLFVLLHLIGVVTQNSTVLIYSGPVIVYSFIFASRLYATSLFFTIFIIDIFAYTVFVEDQYALLFSRAIFSSAVLFIMMYCLLHVINRYRTISDVTVQDLMPSNTWFAIFNKNFLYCLGMLLYVLSVPLIYIGNADIQDLSFLNAWALKQGWLWLVLLIGVVTGLNILFTNAVLNEQRAKQMELLAVEANEEKTLFLSNINHEMRTPLNGIVGMLQVLKMHNHDAKLSKHLSLMEHSSMRLKGLIEDVLDYSNILRGRLKFENTPFKIVTTLNDVVDKFEHHVVQKHLSMAVDIDIPSELTLMGDSKRVEQVLSHLLSNAIKFTSHGRISIKAGFHSDHLTIVVKDTGIGMDEDIQKTMFNLFEQGHKGFNKEFQGAGLGMALVKQIADSLNGSIDVLSSPGKGSIITVVLPMTAVNK